ncbi:MAG: hypothetical protein IPL22_08775 [Bacteroidetes bacterium]|nr:hypothetical protein [Bacteroidota bacterium]
MTEIDSELDADDDNIDDFKMPGEKMHDWGELLTRDDDDEDEDVDDLDDDLF